MIFTKDFAITFFTSHYSVHMYYRYHYGGHEMQIMHTQMCALTAL